MIPTLGQKIAKLIAENPHKNPFNFYKAIVKRFGKDTISQRYLYNVINDRNKAKDTVLYQIASTLGMEIHELVQGTTSEPPVEGPSGGIFPYNKSAILYNLYHGLPFKPQMIKIRGRGKTVEEREEIPGFICFIFVMVIRGEIDLVTKHQDGNTECIKLKLDGRHCFNSGDLHYFENKSKQFSKILLIRFTKPV